MVGIVRKPKSESGRARVAHPRKAKATEFGLKDLASLKGLDRKWTEGFQNWCDSGESVFKA